MTDNAPEISPLVAVERRRRKRWQLAFLICLFAFEAAREAAVLYGAQGAMPRVDAQVYEQDGVLHARGVWQRKDEPFAGSPRAVTIVCRRDINECTEATAEAAGTDVRAPDVQWYRSSMTDDEGMTYSRPADPPLSDCFDYFVEVDVKARQASAYIVPAHMPPSPKCPSAQASQMLLLTGSGGFAVASRHHFAPIMYALFGPHRDQAIHTPRRVIWNALAFVLLMIGFIGMICFIYRDDLPRLRSRAERKRITQEEYQNKSRIPLVAGMTYFLLVIGFALATIIFDY